MAGDAANPGPNQSFNAARLLRFAIASILLLNFGLRLVHLGHPSIKPLDEVFHAIVARSLLSHPLVPTLNESAILSTSPDDWQNAHVWLHKPPLALWQIAASFGVLGVGNFSLRFPSAILVTASAGLTYLIARRLFNRPTAVVAMLLQAFNPVLQMLVQGYVFSDHVDIALLFWSELSIWLLLRLAQTSHRRDALLCGAAQGAAFLAKTFPGLITLLLAITLCLIQRGTTQNRRSSLANLGWILFGTILIAGPWNLYAYLNWPQVYLSQTLGILHHLDRDVEGWAGPWDRLMVDYGWRVFHLFYPLVLVAVALGVADGIRKRDRSMLFTLAWLLLVLLPNLLATSKPMTATLVGWPAVWLIVARLFERAWRADWSAGVGIFISVIGSALMISQPMPASGWGYVSGHPLAGVLMANWQPVAIGIIASLVALAMPTIQRPGHAARWCAGVALVVLLTVPLGRAQPHGYLRDFWRVSQIQSPDPIDPALAAAITRLPSRSIILLKTRLPLEDKLLQWKTARDCWPMRPEQRELWTRQIAQGGGAAYVVTDESLDLPSLPTPLADGRRIFVATAPVGLR